MSTTALSDLTGLSVATISRRHDAAIQAMRKDGNLEQNIARVIEQLDGNRESSTT